MDDNEGEPKVFRISGEDEDITFGPSTSNFLDNQIQSRAEWTREYERLV